MVLYGTLTQALCGASSLRFVILTGAKDLLFGRVSIGLETGHIVSVLPALAEILPSRIGSANQSDFLLAQPTFQVFLSRDSVANVLETLAVYKAVNTVSARESRRGRRPRLPSGAKLRRILSSGTRARAPAPDKHERLAAGLMLLLCSETRRRMSLVMPM